MADGAPPGRNLPGGRPLLGGYCRQRASGWREERAHDTLRECATGLGRGQPDADLLGRLELIAPAHPVDAPAAEPAFDRDARLQRTSVAAPDERDERHRAILGLVDLAELGLEGVP